MQKKQYIILTAIVVITLLTTSGNAIASTINSKNHKGFSFHPKNNLKGVKPGIGGSVAALNGTLLIITSQNGTTYTVDAAQAEIIKGFGHNTQTLALTDIKVGDNIGVMGTVSGTKVVAKTIIDGVGRIQNKKPADQQNLHLVGTILDVSPYSFTMNIQPFGKKDKSSTSTLIYTVDTNSNTITTKDRKTASLGDLASGQTVIITGNIDNNAKIATATKIDIITLKTKPVSLFKINKLKKHT